MKRINSILALTVALLPFQALAHGDLHHRILAVSEQISKDSLNGELYLKRGQLLLEHDQLNEALADFQKSLTLDEDLIGSHLGIAQVKAQWQQVDSGLLHVNIFLHNYPHHPKALELRANLCQQKGLYAEAVSDLETLLRTAEQPRPEYFLGLAAAQERLYPNAVDVPLSTIEEGIAQLGFVISLYNAAVQTAMAHRSYDSALRYVNEVLEHMPESPHWLVRKGEVYAAANMPAEALICYNHALSAIEELPSNLQVKEMTQALKSETEQSIRKVQAK